MTQEEKARAYDEALERAKMILCNIPEGSASVRDIETIFPELRESEDERIRKELVAFFIEVRNREGNEGYWHDLKVADILAYLEKQKEQKPVELNWDETSIAVRNPEAYKIGFADGEAYAREELKPEWSEEDKKMIDDIIRALPKMAEAEDNILPEILPSVARKYVERLKSLRPQPHWKPTEEQIYSLGTVVKGYNECTVGSVGYNLKELYEQLKAL